ncbi:MAG: type II toxin-antitoxin system VapC family toxin [Zavarzinella sp.]|nr:type II toxin-antitoxin system VapC family toxin [Zavarzinella sp.]
MILLDTDHFTVFTDERDPRHEQLRTRLEAADEPVVCTIVTVEEVLRGWLAFIHRHRDVRRQIPAYSRLGRLIDVLGDWEVVPFDERAADRFAGLRQERLRIGTMDIKIAAIALVHDALLVTANFRDFSAVRGLRCENWLSS